MSTRPPLVGSDSPHQVYLSEGGPVDVHEDELAVSPLPEEEVAQPLLSRGADYQVRLGVREVRGIEPSRDRLLSDLARGEPPVLDIRGDRPHHIGDLHPTSIRDSNVEVEVIEIGGALLQLSQYRLGALGQEFYLAHRLDPNPVSVYPFVVKQPFESFFDNLEDF